MNGCNQEDLLLLAAGEASPDRSAELSRHVAGCPVCAGELARLRESLAALDGLPPLEPSGRAVERMVAAGRLAVSRRRVLRSILHRARPLLAVAASLALVFLIGVLVGRPGKDTSQIIMSDKEFKQIWETPSHDLAGTGEMVDDLVDQHAGSQWTVAEAAVIRSVSQSNLDDELLRLDESLEQLENLSWDS